MKEMGTGLIPIFWGIVLVDFDYTYDSFSKFSLSPDFVGYSLIVFGLGSLISLSRQFAIARICAWLLIPVSIILWLYPSTSTVLRPLDWAVIGLDTAMIWTLLGGINEYGVRRNQLFLTKWSSAYRLAYVGLWFIAMALWIVHSVAPPPPTNDLGLFFAAGLVIIFLWIYLSLMILDLLYRFKVDLDKQSFS